MADAESKPKNMRCAPRPVVCWETSEVFPSMRSAALAVGLKTGGNIRYAIDNYSTVGGFHWYWADAPKPSAEQLSQARKCPVVCYETGAEFESIAAAARAVGARSCNVFMSLGSGGSAGGFHWYKKGDPKPDPSSFKGNGPVVCWETGRAFGSTQEAADWAKCTRSAINFALKTKAPAGGFHWYREGSPKPKLEELKYHRSVVCLETGEVFPNLKKAAEFAGLKDGSHIRRAASGTCKNGRRRSAGGYHWYWEGDPKPVLAEPKPKAKDATRGEHREKKVIGRPVVCWESGEVYPSAEHAARVVGLKSAKSIRQALDNPRRSAGGYHWYREGNPRPDESEFRKPKQKKAKEPAQKPRPPIVCVETGEVFPTTKEAAASVGLKDISSINSALRKGSTAGGFHWHLQGSKPIVPDSKAKGRTGRPVVCWETGQAYVSTQAAADAVGVKTRGNISNAANTGIMAGSYHWYWKDQPRPDASAFKPPKSRPIICVETGIVYESAVAAAKAIGAKHPNAITRAVRKSCTAYGFRWRSADDTHRTTA